MFEEDASKIQNTPLNFERCREYSNQMNEDQLRKYIMNECENFRRQGLNDVSIWHLYDGGHTRRSFKNMM